MKPSDIFCLVVRLSGYFTVFYAAYWLIMAVLGPLPLTFGGFVLYAAYSVAGLVIMRIAPAIGAIAYPGTASD